MESHEIQIYPGSGKKPWDRSEKGYPLRSHDCMLNETEFVETFQDAQEDLGQRGKNQNQRRTMMIWINALENEWETCSIEAARKIIGRQPKIMRMVIEADGGQTPY